MHIIKLFSHWHSSEREARLLANNMGPGSEQPFAQRWFGDFESQARDVLRNARNPDMSAEQQRLQDTEQLAAFKTPDIFTSPVIAHGAEGTFKERLQAMTIERRLQELQAFVTELIPPGVRAAHADIFTMTQEDIDNCKLGHLPNHIRTILNTLSILLGQDIPVTQDPDANIIAREAMAETTNTSNSPGVMYRLYEDWMDRDPGRAESDATTPEFLLSPESGIPDQLRGILQTMDPLVAREMLRQMYSFYRGKQTDNELIAAQNRTDYLELTGSVERQKIENQTRGFIENFNNADPRLKLLMGAAGLFLVWKLWKAKNPLGRWAMTGAVGWYAYDRFVNGNENAFNDMANGVKNFVGFAGNGLKNVSRELIGWPGAEGDKLDIMGNFLLQNDIQLGPGQVGMAALSTVNLGTIADAFTPRMAGDILGGELLIQDGGTGSTTEGNNLYRALRAQMNQMNLRAEEKEKTFEYLQTHNADTSKAIAHVFYMLGAQETSNLAAADAIEDAVLRAGSYDDLSTPDKQIYMRIVLEGRQIALARYRDSTLVDIVTDLNSRREAENERKEDTAVEVPDPRTPARENEFALLDNLAETSVHSITPSEVLADDGIVDKDTTEFRDNCIVSGVLTHGGSAALERKFDLLRSSGRSLPEILEVIEELKYAVLVQSTSQDTPLDEDDILLLTGPDDFTAVSTWEKIKAFFSSISPAPRGFSSVSSLGDVSTLMNEPFFGGPADSQGEGFTRLEERMEVYEKRMENLRDVSAVAHEMASGLPATVITAFGGLTKLEEAIRPILDNGNYADRLDRAEEQVSQRMANALARAMRLTHTADGFGRYDTEQSITPTEQKNLETEFDRLFAEIIGDPFGGQFGMMQGAENIDTFNKFNASYLYGLDYTDEGKRLEAFEHARKLCIAYLLRNEQYDPEYLRYCVGYIYDGIEKEKRRLLTPEASPHSIESMTLKIIPASATPEQITFYQTENLKRAQIIENTVPFTEASFIELHNILRILGANPPAAIPTFRNIVHPDLLPPDPNQIPLSTGQGNPTNTGAQNPPPNTGAGLPPQPQQTNPTGGGTPPLTGSGNPSGTSPNPGSNLPPWPGSPNYPPPSIQ